MSEDQSADRFGTAAFHARVERALKEERLLIAAVLENLPLGVGVYDPAGTLTHSNERMRDYAGTTVLPSREPSTSRRWEGYDPQQRVIRPADYPGARALRGESVVPGIDFLYQPRDAPRQWTRVSAVPLRFDGEEADRAIVVVQDIDDLKRSAERLQAAADTLARQSRFIKATLSSIPDCVYAFDTQHRFAYANQAMLALFGLSDDAMIGRTFADLDYLADLAARLNGHIDRILADGVTVEDEVFFRSPTGHTAYFAFLWGPVFADDGSVELVVGVSRETTERRAFEDELARAAARLDAAGELVGLGVYSWDPVTGALDWDDRLRAMWGLPPGAPVDMAVYEAGIHPDDLPRVRAAIAACVDPAGDGRYNVEYRVTGYDDGVTRHISTSGRTTFEQRRAVGFIGAAIDVTAQRRAEAAVRDNEAQFRGFADNSDDLLWIVDPAKEEIVYRSLAFERIWGIPCAEGPVGMADWITHVHPDDRQPTRRALDRVGNGEVVRYEYRIIRPADGAVRWLRDTAFPITDEYGAITRIGGIAEDLTREEERQVYIVSAGAGQARQLAGVVRGLGHRARVFDSVAAFLDIAPVLSPGCVLVDLRKGRHEGLSVPRELKAREIGLPAVVLDAADASVASAVAAMKAGAIDYIRMAQEEPLRAALAETLSDCLGAMRPKTRDDGAAARLARLTPREREVLMGLVDGGTNKMIAQALGISPRTVELHRAQVMSRLNAGSLTELIQITLTAGIGPGGTEGGKRRNTT